MVEHDDPLGAADLLYQLLAFLVVDAADFVIVGEIADLAAVRHKAEALALELEPVGERPSVMQADAMRGGLAALALIDVPRFGDIGDQLLGLGEIAQLRLDRVGGGVEFGERGHVGLLDDSVKMSR